MSGFFTGADGVPPLGFGGASLNFNEPCLTLILWNKQLNQYGLERLHQLAYPYIINLWLSSMCQRAPGPLTWY